MAAKTNSVFFKEGQQYADTYQYNIYNIHYATQITIDIHSKGKM